MNGAQERTRTSTPLRELAPEASASANSATWAFPAAGTTIHIAAHYRVCQRRPFNRPRKKDQPEKIPSALAEQSEECDAEIILEVKKEKGRLLAPSPQSRKNSCQRSHRFTGRSQPQQVALGQVRGLRRAFHQLPDGSTSCPPLIQT